MVDFERERERKWERESENKMSHLCQPIDNHKNQILSIGKWKIYNKIH
jgi:hypothetical protein